MSWILRTLFAFALACLAASAVIVAFVKPPTDLLALPAGDRLQDLASSGMLILQAATHSATFAAPFALIVILLGTVLGTRSVLFYTLAGLAISLFGFAALHAAEATATSTILNARAATAYTLSGLIGGYVYWLLAGRQGRKSRDEAQKNKGKRDRTPPPIVASKSKKPSPASPAKKTAKS